jgi:hypothetical protein
MAFAFLHLGFKAIFFGIGLVNTIVEFIINDVEG